MSRPVATSHRLALQLQPPVTMLFPSRVKAIAKVLCSRRRMVPKRAIAPGGSGSPLRSSFSGSAPSAGMQANKRTSRMDFVFMSPGSWKGRRWDCRHHTEAEADREMKSVGTNNGPALLRGRCSFLCYLRRSSHQRRLAVHAVGRLGAAFARWSGFGPARFAFGDRFGTQAGDRVAQLAPRPVAFPSLGNWRLFTRHDRLREDAAHFLFGEPLAVPGGDQPLAGAMGRRIVAEAPGLLAEADNGVVEM